MKNINNLDQFTNGYIEASLFTYPEDENLDLDLINIQNINYDDLDQIILECSEFQINNKTLLTQAYSKNYSESQAGVDFWLTRNGHGAGFWDRNLDNIGDELTKKAKILHESNLYLGDNNKLYFTNSPKDRLLKSTKP